MLTVRQLTVTAGDQEILHRLNLTVQPGTVVALMGPNGSGKSTLANLLAGHPGYQATAGEALLDGQDLLPLAPEERAQRGLFLAFQYPAAIPGVSVARFLHLALTCQQKARGEETTGFAPFLRQLRRQMASLEMPSSFAERSVNDGFSGGEKKRLEMLQMLVLQPRLAILDEIDSGLDIDAIRLVAQAVSQLDRSRTTVILITHYQRLLDYVQPDAVHVLKEGRIAQSGGPELVARLEQEGYGGL